MRLTTSNATAIAGWAALPVPDVQQVEAGVYNGQDGVYVLSTTQLVFAQLPPTPYGTKSVPQLPPTTAPDATFTDVGKLLHMDIVAHSRLAMGAQGALTAVVTPSEVAFVGKTYVNRRAGVCATAAHRGVTTRSTVVATVAVDMGAVSTAIVAPSHDDDTTHVWVGCTHGVLRATLSPGAVASSVWSLQPPNPVAAIALSPSGDEVAVGTDQKLYILDAAKLGSVIRWEWVTQLSTASGGVVDAPITTMAYDACGSLWIGNAICVNVMFKDRSFIRISGLEVLCERCRSHTAYHCSHTRLSTVAAGPTVSQHHQRSPGLWFTPRRGVRTRHVGWHRAGSRSILACQPRVHLRVQPKRRGRLGVLLGSPMASWKQHHMGQQP